MHLLNLYIIRNFISKFIFLIIGFMSLFLIVDIIDHINKFIDSDIPRFEIINYYLYSLPWFISIALPMTTLLACIFTIGQLQKNHELTAIKASGISLRKLSFVLIALGVLISILSFIFDNTLVSKSIQKKAAISEQYLDRDQTKNQIRKFHILNEETGINQIMYLKNYNFLDKTARDVVVQSIKENFLNETTIIDTMIWNQSKEAWICKGIQKRNNKDKYTLETIKQTTIRFKLEDGNLFKEEDLIKFLPKSEELNYWQLKELSSRRPDDLRLKVDYNFKIAFSCTSLIMILFGIGLSIKKPRTHYATGIGLGIIVIFLYYLGMKFGQTLGYSRMLSPFLSVWFINFIFLSIGGWLFAKIRT
mgnify:CR=1 FL=1